MREIPMMFRDPLVRLIEADIKTQTRRPMVSRRGNPYRIRGGAGDVIWVREAWWPFEGHVEPEMPHVHTTLEGRPATIIYRASTTGRDVGWRPSMNMPRGACRYELRVTARREHPCQDIYWEDIPAEGVGDLSMGREQLMKLWRELWDGIYGECPYRSWAANPMVQCFDFELIR